MPDISRKSPALSAHCTKRPETFVIANAWDAGSARILTALGFKALATSSGACAGVLGRRDGMVTREEAMAHCKAIVDATDLPVSADLEKGFGDTPQAAAETIRLAAGIGLVGASIEDATGDPAQPAVRRRLTPQDRIAAAVEAARAMPFPFILTARTENYRAQQPRPRRHHPAAAVVRGRRRRRADGARPAGPGGGSGGLCRAVAPGQLHGRHQGQVVHRRRPVRRRGSSASAWRRRLYRAAMTGLVNAAKEVAETRTFDYLDETLATPALNAFMQ